MATQDSSWSGWIVFAGIVHRHRRRDRRASGSGRNLQGRVRRRRRAKGVAILDVTAWGWFTLLWGALLVFTGLGLLGGAGWARWLAIIGVAVNAIGQVAFMANYPQAYPLWNILVVALNILVLYALTARWQGFRQSRA